ncbi:MAG: LLM class flavin-dependent oxidoreductase, partial [Candidatus Thorarchaeota archaeon]|nr:LLM class flavin-dependent oxidoreductase [Candidatus Thorarchaeota archaeon]
MAGKKPFRFGVVSNGAQSGQEWVQKARRVQELGYSTLLLPDHFVEQVSITPALMAAAISTESLRVGSIVICNDFRHPVLLAKEAATIDLLSNGRFELGIG